MSTNKVDWERVARALELALSVPSAVAGRALDIACGDDDDARLQARRMLAASRQPESSLQASETWEPSSMGSPCHQDTGGDHFEDLVESWYDDLLTAAKAMRGCASALDDLYAEDLVHGAVVRLMRKPPQVRDRSHFFAVMASAMTAEAMDLRRAEARERRGVLGGSARTRSHVASDDSRLSSALADLESVSREAATAVRLRYLVGLTNHEVANVMELPRRSAERHLMFARIWLAANQAEFRARAAAYRRATPSDSSGRGETV